MKIVQLIAFATIVGISLGMSISEYGPLAGLTTFFVLFFLLISIDFKQGTLIIKRLAPRLFLSVVFATSVGWLYGLIQTLYFPAPGGAQWMFSPFNAALVCGVVLFTTSVVWLIPVTIALWLVRRLSKTEDDEKLGHTLID